jgi:hypothetical protein
MANMSLKDELKEKMSEVGRVQQYEGGDFTVNKIGTPSATAGVYFKEVAGELNVKVTLKRDHVEHLIRHSSFGISFSNSPIRLKIPSPTGNFFVLVRKIRNANDDRLVVYEPTKALDEEIMHKCASLVAAAFNH